MTQRIMRILRGRHTRTMCDATTCSATDAPSHKDLSKLQLTPPPSIQLNLDLKPTQPFVSSASSIGNDSQGLQSAKSPPLLTNTTSSTRHSPSSHDLLTTLSLVVLFNNLMPRPLPPTWALATTAAAWLWLAFHRLQPWLPQSSPPSPSATAATAASGADAVATAAGLSSAATAAGAAAGIGGDPSTRWWQHALLFLELLWGNAVDALLMMGLLLLPIIAFKRWWSGRSMWGSSTPAAATPTAAASMPANSVGGRSFQNLAAAPALRRSFDGVSAQLQSAGNSAARLAKAMHLLASKSRDRRRTSSSSDSSDGSSSSSSGVATPPTHSHATSSGTSSTNSHSTGSMVSPEQSSLQPNTPPLLFVSRPHGPLTGPGRDPHVMLAQPLQVSPTQDEILAGRDRAARAAAATTGRPWHDSPPHRSSSGSSSSSNDSRSSTPDVAPPAGDSDSSRSDQLQRRQPCISNAQQRSTKARPGDRHCGSGAAQDPAAAPSGSHSDSGSSVAASAGLNLGALGTIRTVSAHGPTPPMYPTRALYTSPLETVVISCKLGSSSRSNALPARGTAVYAGPGTVSPRDVRGPAGGVATGAAPGPSSSTVLVHAPLSNTQASLAAGRHGSSIAAQRELRSVVEAAVRQAIADSNVAVLSTTVTSFPGCVHVVATANLTAATLAAAAAAGAESAAAAPAAESQTGAAKVVWQQVVQQISNAQHTAAGITRADDSHTARSAVGVPAVEGLFLKHLLVQDSSGHIHYLWVSPEAAAEAAAVLTAEASITSMQSGSVTSEPVSPTASTTSSKSSERVTTCRSIHTRLITAASGISISSLTLPVDVPDNADMAASLADAASKLLLPAGLDAALADAKAGLRIVLSATPQSPVAHAGSPASGRSRTGSPVSSRDVSSSSRFTLATSASMISNTRFSSRDGGDGDSPDHVLIDHTLWPGTSSWPAGNEFDLQQLLPDGMKAGALRQQFGPVLTLNLVASTRRPTAAVAGGVGDAALPQGKQPQSAAGADSAASIVQSTLAAGVPDASPVQDQMLQRSGSAAQQVHSDIATLVQRLKAGGHQAAATPLSVSSAAPAASGPTAAAAAPLVAAAVDTGSEEAGIGEHLLLQLPLLLLSSTACREVALLQQRMAKELGGDGCAAARQHMLPLINDIVAALNMCSKVHTGAPTAAHGPRLPGAAPSHTGRAAQHAPLDDTSAGAALPEADTADSGPSRLTGVRALIAQQERMAAAAAAAAVATVVSPRAAAATSSPRTALSTRTSRSFSVLSPHSSGGASVATSPAARSFPVCSPSWGRPQPSSPAGLLSNSSNDWAGKVGLLGSNTPAAVPSAEIQPAGQRPLQVEGLQLSTEQRQLVKQIMQYMWDQGLDSLAVTLCSYLPVEVMQDLSNRAESRSGPAPAAVLSTGLGEIEPVLDAHDLDKPDGTAAPLIHSTAAPALVASSAEGGVDPVVQSTISSAGSPAANDAAAADTKQRPGPGTSDKEASKALQQASAAHKQAVAAQRAAAATESALQLALQQISALSAATAEANRQAAAAQATAAAASQRAAAVEQRAERERALQLIGSPAGVPAAGSRGVGIWGLLNGFTWAAAAARSSGSSLLGGTINAAEPPVLPAEVTPRDVLLGFSDERLEVQYRRLKALQCRTIDRAAFLMQLCRQVVYVWRIARLMFVSAGTGLSLVLLCKYEAVVLLPYVIMVLTPDFYIYHRHLLLCLSQIAAALTVGMISATEVYRNEWSALLHEPGPTLLARPSMMLVWYYLLVPLLQQQTLPEQAISCVAQLAHSLLIYVYILKGSVSVVLVLPLLVLASALSFAVTYVADATTRQQAVAAARRTLTRH